MDSGVAVARSGILPGNPVRRGRIGLDPVILFAGKCNLCGWPIVRIGSGPFGTRCVRCMSTQIHRAAGLVIGSLSLEKDATVYELSSRGALHRYLKHRFRRLECSEYYDDVPPGEMRGGARCEDVQRLTWRGGAFDLLTCTEVFEHVPDDDSGFREVFRVLREGGYFVFTVPLLKDRPTIERAALLPDGRVAHLAEPEYHSDRIRGARKVLAFRTYGSDLVARLESAGFSAETRWITSRPHRVSDVPVNVAMKPLPGSRTEV